MESKGEAWLKKYYPVEAETLANASDIECVQHSLNKWRGLTKDVLEKYGLVSDESLIEGDNFSFYIDDDSCALCVKYLVQEVMCTGCPLSKQLGKPCDANYIAPYSIFIRTGNPLLMIKALEKTLLSLQNRKNDGNE